MRAMSRRQVKDSNQRSQSTQNVIRLAIGALFGPFGKKTPNYERHGQGYYDEDEVRNNGSYWPPGCVVGVLQRFIVQKSNHAAAHKKNWKDNALEITSTLTILWREFKIQPDHYCENGETNYEKRNHSRPNVKVHSLDTGSADTETEYGIEPRESIDS